jgi:hypothetical protein
MPTRRGHYRTNPRTGEQVWVEAHEFRAGGGNGASPLGAVLARVREAAEQNGGEPATLPVAGYVAAGEFRGPGQPRPWWQGQRRLRSDEAVADFPEHMSPSSPITGRRTHRITYRTPDGSRIRMPSKSAIRRFQATGVERFDLPVETFRNGQIAYGVVRVGKDDEGNWTVETGSGAYQDGEYREAIQERIQSLVQGRRPRSSQQSLEQTANRLETLVAEQAPEGTTAWSPGDGQERCDTCQRFMAADIDHVCPGPAGDPHTTIDPGTVPVSGDGYQAEMVDGVERAVSTVSVEDLTVPEDGQDTPVAEASNVTLHSALSARRLAADTLAHGGLAPENVDRFHRLSAEADLIEAELADRPGAGVPVDPTPARTWDGTPQVVAITNDDVPFHAFQYDGETARHWNPDAEIWMQANLSPHAYEHLARQPNWEGIEDLRWIPQAGVRFGESRYNNTEIWEVTGQHQIVEIDHATGTPVRVYRHVPVQTSDQILDRLAAGQSADDILDDLSYRRHQSIRDRSHRDEADGYETYTVPSTAIRTIGVHRSTGRMRVRFHDGRVAEHDDVPSTTVASVLSADSVGRAYNEEVRAHHDYARQERFLVGTGPGAPLTEMNARNSWIASSGYDPVTQTLRLRASDGRTYRYEGVLPEDYADIMSSAAPGQTFNRQIRNRYTATPEPAGPARTAPENCGVCGQFVGATSHSCPGPAGFADGHLLDGYTRYEHARWDADRGRLIARNGNGEHFEIEATAGEANQFFSDPESVAAAWAREGRQLTSVVAAADPDPITSDVAETTDAEAAPKPAEPGTWNGGA